VKSSRFGTITAGLVLLVGGAALFPFTLIGMLGWLGMFAGLACLIAGCVAAKAPDAPPAEAIFGLVLGFMGAIAVTYCCVLGATVGVRWGLPAHFKHPAAGMTDFDESTEHILWLCYPVIPAAALAACLRLRGKWAPKPTAVFGLLFALSGLLVALLTTLLCPYLPFGS